MNGQERQALRELISRRVAEDHPYAGNGLLTGAARRRVVDLGDDLTRRELEVLRCAADGLTYPETAERLGIRETTVKHYSQTLRAKLGARTIAHALVIAIGQDLIGRTASASLV